MVLKWRDIYVESIRVGLLVDGLKMERSLKWRSLKLQGSLYILTTDLPADRYCVRPNRTTVHEYMGLGAQLQISVIKPVVW